MNLYFFTPSDWDEPTKKLHITPEEAKEIFGTTKKVCLHEWITYTGLNEKYEFCKHCDEKRSI